MSASLPPELVELYGEPISVYTRADALADGTLVDMTEWASADKGMLGGYRCPVAMTRAVYSLCEVKPGSAAARMGEDLRGRAHDVLWMSTGPLRLAMRRGQDSALYKVIIGRKTHLLRAVADGDGVTIMLPSEN